MPIARGISFLEKYSYFFIILETRFTVYLQYFNLSVRKRSYIDLRFLDDIYKTNSQGI